MDKKTLFDLLERTVEEGETLTKEGEECNEFFLLHEGEVWLYINDKKVGEIKAKENIAFIGEIGVLLQRKRLVTSIAQTKCIVIKVPRQSIEHLIKNAPSIGVKLMRSLAQKAALLYVEHSQE